jgi:hypothetical protein
MSLEEQREEIIVQLEQLNAAVKTQNSIRHIFMTGVIYGVGFFLGSAVIATIAFGIFAPWIGQIGWIRDNFTRGAELSK